MHPPGLCSGGCIFICCLYTAQMGRQSPPISRYLLRKNTCTPLVRRRGPAVRTIPLGIPPNITFPPIRVVAKSALLRFLPFGESSARSLAPPFPAVTAPLGPGGNFTLRPIGQSRWEFPPNITFPPIHSNGEWGGLLIDWIVQWSVPRTFLDSVRCWGKSGNSRVSPILKTLGTRSHLLWSLPKLARVAHHSEECFVFGFAGVHCFEEFLIAERFRFSGISELTSPWDSLLSCVYNIQ